MRKELIPRGILILAAVIGILASIAAGVIWISSFVGEVNMSLHGYIEHQTFTGEGLEVVIMLANIALFVFGIQANLGILMHVSGLRRFYRMGYTLTDTGVILKARKQFGMTLIILGIVIGIIYFIFYGLVSVIIPLVELLVGVIVLLSRRGIEEST